MLMGLFLLPEALITASFGELAEWTAKTDPAALWLPCSLLLVGSGAKAGAFPLHVWLPRRIRSRPRPRAPCFPACSPKPAFSACWC
jgi:hydrogenase-4 component B